MRHVTFIRPRMGAGRSADAMAPLVFAILRGLTPPDIETTLIDERVEDFEPVATDLVAITVETFSALRAWQIADFYRALGVPVVVGGHHPSMVPDEALRHADAVVMGDAENVWSDVLRDAAAGRLRSRYQGGMGLADERSPVFDRSIFAGKRYAPVELVQAGRGCRFACDFCSIHAFYGTARAMRPAADVAAEIATLPRRRLIFFVDDNLLWKRDRFIELMDALAPLKRMWSCQITIDMARDDELMDRMARAGCAAVLIGFESLDAANLKQMRKNWNHVAGSYDDVIARLHRRGIMIYATFVFGYDRDTVEAFSRAAAFAVRSGVAIANFNPLTPMPGTGLYERLKTSGGLVRPEWWIDPSYAYGDPIFLPKGMTAAELRDGPMQARWLFYGWRSILQRAGAGILRWKSLRKIGLMLVANLVSRQEIRRKQAQALSPQRGSALPAPHPETARP